MGVDYHLALFAQEKIDKFLNRSLRLSVGYNMQRTKQRIGFIGDVFNPGIYPVRVSS